VICDVAGEAIGASPAVSNRSILSLSSSLSPQEGSVEPPERVDIAAGYRFMTKNWSDGSKRSRRDVALLTTCIASQAEINLIATAIQQTLTLPMPIAASLPTS
jgi:hypothetical protein